MQSYRFSPDLSMKLSTFIIWMFGFIVESGFRFVALVTVDHKTYWTVIDQCAKVTSFESFGLIGSV